MSEQTPGPWFFEDSPRLGQYQILAKQGPLLVMVAVAFGLPDARLVVAAPDMLDALKHCVIERSEWLEEARAAIRKATGRKP